MSHLLILIPIGGIAFYIFKQLMKKELYTESTSIENKVVIITGANKGIGFETAIDLAKRGGKIYIACRDQQRGQNALDKIRKFSGSDKVYFLELDLASLKSIHKFSQKFHSLENKLDILINNAGLLSHKKLFTEEGFELHMGVNHLGHFLLTHLLLNLLKDSPEGRIVIVSSELHKAYKMDQNDFMSENNFSAYKAYGRSKLANVLFARKLSNILKGSNVSVNSCHPGLVQTEISQEFKYTFMDFLTKICLPFGKTPFEGAQTQIMIAVDPKLKGVSGKYFSDCHEAVPSSEAFNDENAEWLWRKSAALVGV